jgi:6-phosphogluconolactonase (cycloisomerase 2 family)
MNGIRRVFRVAMGVALTVTTVLSTIALGAGSAAAATNTGAVYVLTNTAANNAVAIYNRGADGSLTAAGSVLTRGAGAGAGLGSQGAIVLSENGQWLFAVNAGSNEITSFAVQSTGLTAVSKVSSGGKVPISLTVHKDYLYVLNGGTATDPGNIAGFMVSPHGALTPLPGSARPLSSGAAGSTIGPAEVSFNPAGDLLVVTEKNTNKIDVYDVDDGGIAQAPITFASHGAVPFGFAFNKRGYLIVSEAGPGALSSYDASEDSFQVISGSVSTQQLAPCWVIATKNGKFAYTTDAHSGAISGFRIGNDGSLTALTPGGITGNTGGAPLDIGLSVASHFLYADNSGTHGINVFAVQSDGTLAALPGVTGLPASAVGLAAR